MFWKIPGTDLYGDLVFFASLSFAFTLVAGNLVSFSPVSPKIVSMKWIVAEV